MSGSIPFSPFALVNAPGSFNVESTGYVQGSALDQPAIRYSLAGGVLAAGQTLPMWGGVGITEKVPGANPTSAPAAVLGPLVGRATTLTSGVTGSLTGFSVFDQDYAMVNTPQSPVPLSLIGGEVNYYRLGTGMRVCVQCDPNLAVLLGEVINTPVSWDFVNQLLIPYAATTISSGTYNSGTGLVTLTLAAATTLNPGDTVIISGATGTGSYASINGQYVAGTGTTGTTVTYTIATGLTLTITGGTLSTGGILPVEVLDLNIGNSMTVVYNSGTGAATWNRSGNCAVIRI